MRKRDERWLSKTKTALMAQANEQVGKMEGSGCFSTEYYQLCVDEVYKAMVEELGGMIG